MTNEEQVSRDFCVVDGPAWRFKLADRLVQRGDAPKQLLTDPYVRAYWNNLADPSDPQRDSKLQADVFQAVALRQHRMTKIKIEARIVAGQDDAEIAHRMHTTPEVVLAYRKLFMEKAGGLFTTTIVGCHCTDSVEGLRDSLQTIVLLHCVFIDAVVVESLLEHVDLLGREHDLTTSLGRALEKLELAVMADELQHRDYASFNLAAMQRVRDAFDVKPQPRSLNEILGEVIDRWVATTLTEADPIAGSLAPLVETNAQHHWRQSRGLA